MGHILSSLKTKPGYGAFVADFHMPKSMMSSAQEQIYLFVAQTDNLDTSSCIVTPQQVNFLINGKGVKGRINSSLDKGPQHPTNVTAMLKCGINLLQVVGQFNGHYIVVIALMGLISSSETPVLQDYVQPVVAALDTDFEIKVGLLRISLNCPISCRLIRTPVKGRLCKHLQCFDYENFMEINSRKPSWRCPLCDQSVCYPDIRIDQNIVKILKEVGENIAEVIVSTDGSWKAVLESEDHKDGQGQRWQQEGSDQCESIEFSRIPADVIDLAMGGDSDACGLSIFGREKKNPFLDNLEGYFTSGNLVAPEVNDTFRVDQNASAQMEDDFWSGIMFASTSAPQHLTAPATNSDSRTDAGISYTPPFNFMHSRVLADAVSPAPSRESVDSREETHFTLSLPQNQLFDPSSLRNVSPTPSAIQSISAQAQGPSSCQQIRALNSSVPSVASSPTPQSTHSMALNTVGFAAVNGGTESDQQLSRLLMNSVPVSNVASSSTQHHSVTQSGVEHDRRLVSGKSAQQVIAGLPVQSPDAHSRPSRFPSLLQNPNHSIPSNWRTSNTMTQSQNVVHPSIHVQSVQIQQKCGGVQATGAVTNKQPMLRAAAQQTAQVSRSPPSVPVQLQASRTGTAFSIGMVAERLKTTGEQRQTSGGTTQPISRPDGSSTLASTHNWRPTGRMRGSLTGEAYSAALSQFMIQPTQPAAQDSQSPSNLTVKSSWSIAYIWAYRE
ncbi:hypothetical protein L1049_013371 [Liquidambar formosana]|uniref:SP-RING-type domain-containing protein n=1 Tax=Liquidambar formosana TaxID=63359 RepID=A0AAP0RPW2_LIQFO